MTGCPLLGVGVAGVVALSARIRRPADAAFDLGARKKGRCLVPTLVVTRASAAQRCVREKYPGITLQYTRADDPGDGRRKCWHEGQPPLQPTCWTIPACRAAGGCPVWRRTVPIPPTIRPNESQAAIGRAVSCMSVHAGHPHERCAVRIRTPKTFAGLASIRKLKSTGVETAAPWPAPFGFFVANIFTTMGEDKAWITCGALGPAAGRQCRCILARRLIRSRRPILAHNLSGVATITP